MSCVPFTGSPIDNYLSGGLINSVLTGVPGDKITWNAIGRKNWPEGRKATPAARPLIYTSISLRFHKCGRLSYSRSLLLFSIIFETRYEETTNFFIFLLFIDSARANEKYERVRMMLFQSRDTRTVREEKRAKNNAVFPIRAVSLRINPVTRSIEYPRDYRGVITSREESRAG